MFFFHSEAVLYPDRYFSPDAVAAKKTHEILYEIRF